MRRRNNRKAAGAVVFTGVATLASLGLMHVKSGPAIPPHTLPNDAGIKSSMLWLELAVDRNEVFANLGPSNSDEGIARRRQLDTANYYDFGFMVCYSLFNASLIYFVTHLNLYRFRKLLRLRVFLGLGLILAGAMLLGDIVENLQLLRLTKAHTHEGILTSTMESLMYWTRVKWGAIFIMALMLCAGYTAYFRRVQTLLLSAVYAVAGVSGLVAISWIEARPLLESISVPAITLAWLFSLLHGAVVLVRGPQLYPIPAHMTVPAPASQSGA